MSSDSITFEAAVPILTVADLKEAIRFYENVLGFRTGWTHGDPPVLASIVRDKVELNLRQRLPVESAGVSRIYFEVSDVDSFFARIQTSAAYVKEPLADREYGMRDFSMRDLSGNELGFGMSIVK
jgi:uncharacterized glyoxalase superfamily protein PhnB